MKMSGGVCSSGLAHIVFPFGESIFDGAGSGDEEAEGFQPQAASPMVGPSGEEEDPSAMAPDEGDDAGDLLSDDLPDFNVEHHQRFEVVDEHPSAANVEEQCGLRARRTQRATH